MRKKINESYGGFAGKVGKIFSTSEPDWPKPPTAPEGSPNVLVMLVDDLGFSDLGCFGSEIDTPNIDALAAGGIRYTNFHVNPMCSPTRASLLTGLNSHMAGMGHVAHFDPGFPGYAMELRENAVTMGDLFQVNGWASLMVGKWHLCKDSQLSEAGPKHSWPLQKGFERFYGILGGFTNFHHPHRLYEDNHALDIDTYPEDYYFTDDLTDQALKMVRELRSSHPAKPWFMYFAHGAVHAPLQAKEKDIEKYRGKYEAGWDQIREQRFKKQKEIGVIPPHVELPERNHEEGHAVKAWDELTPKEKELFARYQEIFAGMVDNVDQNFKRLRDGLEELGEWENTIIVFTSDNGGSREGQELGTSAYFRTLLAFTGHTDLESTDIDHDRLDLLGGPRALAHYPMGWAMTSNTPFRLYKTNTHQGGQQVPFIISWQKKLLADNPLRSQYQHVTDLLPTICDLVGIKVPTEKEGEKLPKPAGSSFIESLHKPEVDSTHTEQYYEMIGHRGMYHEGWSASTIRKIETPFSEESWELHNLENDPTEIHDISDEFPEKVKELEEKWEQAAWDNQVFPLDEGNNVKNILRPPWNEKLVQEMVLYPGTPTVERWKSQQLISFRNWSVEVEFDYKHADQGTLFAHGDQGGGYALYVLDGNLLFSHNGYGEMTNIRCGAIPDGHNKIILSVIPPDFLHWDVEISLNGVVTASHKGLLALLAMAPFQGIDVGIDRKSPVNWEIYEKYRNFSYTGLLGTVRYLPGDLTDFAGSKWVDFLKEEGKRFE
jgi:arylsulfatase|tara:strand:+ start:69515 stop:71830 length:2316 start_codon:yes stop_codon:yes gene_type:complete